MLLPGLAQVVEAAEGDSAVTRISGKTRIETAVEASKEVYPGGAKNVVIAGYDGEIDALTGTVLANAKNAPLLLTKQGKLSDATKAELTRLGAENVYILGGSLVVSEAVEAELDKDYTVKRVKGTDREGTAQAAAKEAGVQTTQVFLANGHNNDYADALAVGPASAKNNMPVLLTKINEIPANTKAAMEAFKVSNVTIVGGESAVSAELEAELAKDYTVKRVKGTDREGTAIAIAKEYFKGSDKAVIAKGYDVIADALVGGYVGAKVDAPMLLTRTNSIKAVTKTFIEENTKKAWVLGGTGVVSASVVNEIEEAIKGEEAEDLKVVSVSAINAKEVEIKFNKAVDKATVVSGTTLQNISITGIGTAGTNHVAPGTTKTVLSEDGKTLTVTAQAATANFFDGQYAVTVPVAVTDKAGKAIEAYTQILTVNDTTRPTVKSVTYPDNNKAKIIFSEPLNSIGTVTFSNAKVTLDTFNVNDNSITVDLVDSSLTINTDYTVTILGAKDGAGNLISPNPVNVTVKKTTIDDVKPEVAALEAVKTGVMKITFSEKLKANATGKIGEFVVGSGTAQDIIIPGGTGTVNSAIDTTGKIVTVTNAALTAGVKTITIQNYIDLSTNAGDAFTKVLDFKNDETAPKLVTSVVKKDSAGTEFLHLTFDEPVTAGTVTGLTATQYKDFVTTTNTMDLTGLTAVPTTNDTEYKVALNAAGVKFNSLALVKGAKYTVTLTGAFSDKASTPNPLGATTITFERAEDVLTAKPKVTGIAQSASDNNVLEVQFDMPVNGATATNVANYSVEGLTVASATLVPGNKVELKLAVDSNAITGFRNVTVSGVKSSDGVAMDSKTVAVNMKENVRPTITKAQIMSATTIKVKFSELVVVTGLTDNNDFEVYVDGTKATIATVAGVTAGSPANDDEFLITFGTPSITDLSKPVTVKEIGRAHV